MIDVEVLGASTAADVPPLEDIRLLCELAAQSAGIGDGHVAVEFVDAQRMAELNGAHRGKAEATDVLSFPIDGVAPLPAAAGASAAENAVLARAHIPRELGDIVICPEHTVEVREAIVHGMLHLLGMDHETDDGEMLDLQRSLLERAAR